MTLAEERAEETKVEFEQLGIDTEGVDLLEVDEAEIKIVEELDQLDEELAEDFLDVVDGDVTVEEVSALIKDDNFDEISDDAKVILAAALTDADDDVKHEFEEVVNIFEDESFNEYVAEGSVITTEERRTVVAATAAVAATAGAAASGGGGGGGSDGPRKRGGSSRRSK